MKPKTLPFTIESDQQAGGFRKFGKVKENGLDWPVRCAQLPRSSICVAEDRPGVYILLDFTHGPLICYVGQTGDRRGSPGSLKKRLSDHNRQRPWWTHVVYFYGDDFDSLDLREWIESKLFVMAQEFFSVVSTAKSLGKLSTPRDGEQILRQVLYYCSVLGLPLAEVPPDSSSARLKTIALLESDLPAKTSTASAPVVPSGPKPTTTPTDYTSKTPNELRELCRSRHIIVSRRSPGSAHCNWLPAQLLRDLLAGTDVGKTPTEIIAAWDAARSAKAKTSRVAARTPTAPRTIATTHTSSHRLSSEPSPGKNHNAPCGKWKSLDALAKAIARKFNGGKGGNGLAQVLRNDWNAQHKNWRRAGSKWHGILSSIGIVFDSDGFVADCSAVPCPLP